MRLQEMYYLIKYTVNNWVKPDLSEVEAVNPKSHIFICHNPRQIRECLEPLRVIPSISDLIDDLYACSIEFTIKETAYIDEHGRAMLTKFLNSIRNNLSAMIDMCEALGLENDSSGFDIKLPSDMTLPELSECTRDLNNIFTQCPLLRSDDEQIKLRGVDVGSMWLTFTIIGAGAATAFYIVNNIATMVDKIVTVREHNAVCKQQEELARQAGLKSEELQTIVDANKTIIKTMTRKVAEELASENDITAPEDIEAINGSLNMLKEWIDKGMEVYAAIDAPEEVKAAFPPLEMQAIPSSEIKELKQHQDDKEE